MAQPKTIEQVMTRDVEVVNPEDTLQEAAEKMRALNVGPMPVCEGDRLLGMITDRDIVVRAVALGHDPSTSKVADIMSEDVHFATADTSIDEAARIMKENQIRRLLVVDKNKKLIGIVSLGDLSQATSEQLAGETLGAISTPSAPNL